MDKYLTGYDHAGQKRQRPPDDADNPAIRPAASHQAGGGGFAFNNLTALTEYAAHPERFRVAHARASGSSTSGAVAGVAGSSSSGGAGTAGSGQVGPAAGGQGPGEDAPLVHVAPHFVLVRDKYPKAQLHLLALARPSKAGAGASSSGSAATRQDVGSGASGVEGSTGAGTDGTSSAQGEQHGAASSTPTHSPVDASVISSLAGVRTAADLEPRHAEALQQLVKEPLHVHIISPDRMGPATKNKKHYNSFATEFFMPINTVVRRLQAAGLKPSDSAAAASSSCSAGPSATGSAGGTSGPARRNPPAYGSMTAQDYEALLDQHPVCHKCGHEAGQGRSYVQEFLQHVQQCRGSP